MPSLVKATGKWKVQVNRRTNDRGKRFYDVYGFKSKKLAAKFEKEMNLKASLNANTLEDMRYQIMLLDLQIDDQQQILR